MFGHLFLEGFIVAASVVGGTAYFFGDALVSLIGVS
jgi:hypothetical protein